MMGERSERRVERMGEDEKIVEEVVKAMPRARLEAEDIAEFPLESRAPGRHENAQVAIKPQATRRRKMTDLAQARVESLSEPTAVDYAERKRALPPLTLVPKPRRAFDLKRDKRWIERRESTGPDEAQVKAELAQSVAKMPMRWEKPKA